jgi:Na+/H+ antiporter NhaC
MILFVPAAVILALTFIGIPLTIILTAGTLMLYVVATGYAALVLGATIMNRLQKTEEPSPLVWTHALLGAVVYATLQLLGPIGFLLLLLLTLATLGALLRTIWNTTRRERTLEPAP